MRGLLYIVFLMVVTACSCGGGYSASVLDEAQGLMMSDPGGALERLNAIDVAGFEDSASVARWALLYSEALDANRLKAPTDTIVDFAIGFYESRGLPDELRRAREVKQRAAANGMTELATALYLQKEKEFFLYRERVRHGWIVAVALLLIVAACGVIAWQRERLRVHGLQAEALVAEAAALRAGMEGLEGRLAATLDNRFALIDQLCGTYYESQGASNERKALAERVKTEIEALKADEGIFGEIERAVNDCRGGMLDMLRTEMPGLKPADYRLTVYLAGHLSARTIALLTGESMDVVYKRKSRLKARIAAANPPHAGLFLSVF